MQQLLLIFLLLLSASSPPLALAEPIINNVTIPNNHISIPGVTAYLLSFGEVKEDVERASFSFSLPTEQLALLYTFRRFEFPNSRFHCAYLECILNNTKLRIVSSIAASCHDNSNPSLYGPIVVVPEASAVSCKMIWYYPEDKSALLNSLNLLFVAAYDGYCESAPSTLMDASEWCNVEVKGLVDDNYEPTQRALCMEVEVAKEVLNATCSDSTHFLLLSPSILLPCVIIVGIFLFFVVLCLVRFCIRKSFKRTPWE